LAGPGQFAGRVALVTGGTRGIGAAITRALAREGARVYAVFRANLAAATVLADEVGDDVITVCADVSEAEAANSLVERAPAVPSIDFSFVPPPTMFVRRSRSTSSQ
jgi:NAD(P)-dependent dehydrogenase (short-subunit alcohol dehydrogenase family)